jgi:hypothetical protein
MFRDLPHRFSARDKNGMRIERAGTPAFRDQERDFRLANDQDLNNCNDPVGGRRPLTGVSIGKESGVGSSGMKAVRKPPNQRRKK